MYVNNVERGQPEIYVVLDVRKPTNTNAGEDLNLARAAILNLILVIPLQMMQIDRIIARHSAQLPKPQRPGNNVFFVHAPGGFYLADLVQADPLLRSDDLILFSRGPELDAELRRQNWPKAALVAQSTGVEMWNLGLGDKRKTLRDQPGVRRFEFEYSMPAM